MNQRSGLRRFVGEAPAQPAAPPPQVEVERCELCGNSAGPGHGHLVDVQNRSLMCACRACALLFTSREAGQGRYRAVPTRVLSDREHPLTMTEWESLGIPVGSAFFLRGADGVAAFYPSPAGATECMLDLDALAELAHTHPLLDEAEQDVEALLVRTDPDHAKGGGSSADGTGVEVFLVPIDACYQLVGTVRMYWQGFDGGEEARTRIDEFFANVRAMARPLTASPAPHSEA